MNDHVKNCPYFNQYEEIVEHITTSIEDPFLMETVEICELANKRVSCGGHCERCEVRDEIQD